MSSLVNKSCKYWGQRGLQHDFLRFLNDAHGIRAYSFKSPTAAASALPTVVLREGAACRWLEVAVDENMLETWNPTLLADDPAVADGPSTWEEEIKNFNTMMMLASKLDLDLRSVDWRETPEIRKRWNRNVTAYSEQKRQVDTDFNFHGDDGNENIRCNDLVAELQKTTPRESAFTRYEFQVVIHHAGKEKRFFDALLAAEPRLQVSLAIFCLYLKTKHIHNYTTIKIVVF
jgi:hypothetical protein